jgi:hypothetical protein
VNVWKRTKLRNRREEREKGQRKEGRTYKSKERAMEMDSLRTDSPLTRRVVRSFLQFLSSVQAAPGVDSEGIEVAAQCLSEVFKLNQQHDGDNNSPLPSLPDLFKLHTSSSSSGLLVQPQASSDRVMADAAVDVPMPEFRSSPPPSSSSLDSHAFGFNENVANMNVVKASKPTLFVLYTCDSGEIHANGKC